MRRDLFRVSVRWHADDIDDSYRQEELRILQLIDRAAGDYYANMDQFPSRISLDPRYFAFDVVNEVQSLARIVLRHLRTVGSAIAGTRRPPPASGGRYAECFVGLREIDRVNSAIEGADLELFSGRDLWAAGPRIYGCVVLATS